MKSPYDIIIRPVITEKAPVMPPTEDTPLSWLLTATKTEVRRACEKLFGVKVLSVNTINYQGKKKRQGVHQGMTPSWKKAVVTIDTDPQAETYLSKGGKVNQTSRKYKTAIEEFGFGQ
jgi:large subunit ribosomal protein L23